jgi:hypothetical protein
MQKNNIKERIFLNKNEEAFATLKKLRKMQDDLDKKKKVLRRIQHEARSLSQKIPNELRRWKY